MILFWWVLVRRMVKGVLLKSSHDLLVDNAKTWFRLQLSYSQSGRMKQSMGLALSIVIFGPVFLVNNEIEYFLSP